jgi:hypothetical protein
LPVLDKIRHHPHKLGHAIDHGGSGSLQVHGLGDPATSFKEIVDGVPRIFILFCTGGFLRVPFKSESRCKSKWSVSYVIKAEST